jgi:hypothetical protein
MNIDKKIIIKMSNSEVSRAAAVGDVETVNKWLTARGYTHDGQLWSITGEAVIYGHDNICQLLLDCDAIRSEKRAMNHAFTTACGYNQLSIAKRVIQHCSMQRDTLTEALLNTSANGQAHIVEWLISHVMHLSYTDRIRWTFFTACVCNNIRNATCIVLQYMSHYVPQSYSNLNLYLNLNSKNLNLPKSESSVQ